MLHVEICDNTRKGLKPFIELPFHLYRDDPNWVPPLISYQYQTLLGQNNLFGKTSRALVLYDEDQPVARVLAGYDEKQNALSGQKQGSLALFECAPGLDYARVILDEACAYLKARGLEYVTGPDRVTTDGLTKGILTEGFDMPPVLLNPYNPPIYKNYFEKNGFTKYRDYYAFKFEMENFDPSVYGQIAARAQKRFGFRVEHINISSKNEKRLVNDLCKVITTAFPQVAEFFKPDEQDILRSYKLLRQLSRPEMAVMAYSGNEPIGVLVAFPDYNRVLKKIKGNANPWNKLRYYFINKHITGARCNLQFVVPEWQNKGVNLSMLYEVYTCSRRLGMRWFECSSVDETATTLISSIENLGCVKYKTYTRFGKAL